MSGPVIPQGAVRAAAGVLADPERIRRGVADGEWEVNAAARLALTAAAPALLEANRPVVPGDLRDALVDALTHTQGSVDPGAADELLSVIGAWHRARVAEAVAWPLRQLADVHKALELALGDDWTRLDDAVPADGVTALHARLDRMTLAARAAASYLPEPERTNFRREYGLEVAP